MTIWGTYVFAKPLGRCVQVLRELQAAENMPAMNNLIRTLDEYLQATDVKAREVYRKAIGRPVDGVLPLTPEERQALPEPLTNAEMKAIFDATCGTSLIAADWADLGKFARTIEARVRLEMNAETEARRHCAHEELDEALRNAQLAQPEDGQGNGVTQGALADGK